LAIEIQEARAQSARLINEALAIDLVDGRTIIVPLVWFPVFGTARRRSATILKSAGTAPTSTGLNLMRT